MWVAFALQKLLTFFQQKFQHICVSLDVNFNESLTNDVVSFEQLGPEQESIVSICLQPEKNLNVRVIFIIIIYNLYNCSLLFEMSS